jgi:uncharacterized protein (TIGR01619 family)
MTEHWDAYIKSIDDNMATLIVDLGLYETAPDAAKPYLMKLTLNLLHPNEDGFYDEREMEVIDDIEDKLSDLLEGEHQAAFVARVTTNGNQEFYFYVPKQDGMDVVIKAFNTQFKDYPLAIEFSHDPEWHTYTEDLFPTPIEMQLMQNYHLTTQLETSGDQLETPRIVTHYAFFASEANRDKFLDAVQKDGFTFADWVDGQEDDVDTPFGVSFEREDPVDIFSANELTISLFELALEHEGEYDGWETEPQ